MKAAHIVIVITETDGSSQPILQYSCSGGDELGREDSKEIFDYINATMSKLFDDSQGKLAEDSYLK